MNRVSKLSALVSAPFLLFSSNAAVVNLESTSQITAVGSSIFLALKIDGLSAAPLDSLGAFDIDLQYDSAILKFLSVSFIDPLSAKNQLDQPGGLAPFLGEAIESHAGRLDVFGASGNEANQLDTLQANSFTFALLKFESLDLKTTSISLDTSDLGLLFVNSESDQLNVSFGRSTQTISAIAPIPEPSGALVSSLFLIGLFGARRLHRWSNKEVGPQAHSIQVAF